MEGERPRRLSLDGVREAGLTSLQSALRTSFGPGVGFLVVLPGAYVNHGPIEPEPPEPPVQYQ